MKVYVIKASANSLFKDYKRFMGAPPQSIYSLAAVTPEYIDIDLIDETSEGEADINYQANIVAIFMSTPDAKRGYQLAEAFRRRGITVVFGGLHASFLPEEALQYGDAVMCGETEHHWPQLLADFQAGKLQRIYENKHPVLMKESQGYPHEYMDLTPYKGLGSVMVSRGCKFKCNFCTVHEFFPKFQSRPVGDIVDEIKRSGLSYVELHADNLIADRDYALELCEALKPLNIKWLAEATLNIAEHEDILQAAAESGLFYLLVGLETPSRAALKAAGKGFIKVEKAKEYIQTLHHYEIAVDSAMIFGFDQHDESIFEESLDFVEDIELDVCHSVTLTPFPGTALFAQLERENRLLTRDWSKYDCNHVVFQPAQMTAEQLTEGVQWFYDKYNSTGRSIKRQFTQVRNLGLFHSSYFNL